MTDGGEIRHQRTGRRDGGGHEPVAENCERQDAAVSTLIDARRVNICHLVDALQYQECVYFQQAWTQWEQWEKKTKMDKTHCFIF